MTGEGQSISDAGRRWAAGLLGVAEDAPLSEARRAFFRLVRENNFVAPRPVQRAFRILHGDLTVIEPDDELLIAEEERLSAHVESFATNLFSHSMEERRRRWNSLASQCQGIPPLCVRLQDLKPSLDIDMESLPEEGSGARALVALLLELFPMPPLARATSRQYHIRGIEASTPTGHRQIERTARYLATIWPELVVLDEPLVLHLAELRRCIKKQARLRKQEPTGVCWKCGFGPILYDATNCPSCQVSNPNPGIVMRLLPFCAPPGFVLGCGAGFILGCLGHFNGNPGVGGIVGAVFGSLIGMSMALILGLALQVVGKH